MRYQYAVVSAILLLVSPSVPGASGKAVGDEDALGRLE